MEIRIMSTNKQNCADFGVGIGETIATDQAPLFRCTDCGAEELTVTRNFVRVSQFERYVPCDCGDNEVAVERRYRNESAYEQSGVLKDDHRVEFDSPEHVEDLGDEDEGYEVFCPKCAEDADESAWQMDPHQIETEDTDDEFYVRCSGCGREIEFGWSHPDRGGRIWPAECSDFNPWKCWPEPRYKEAWQQKG